MSRNKCEETSLEATEIMERSRKCRVVIVFRIPRQWEREAYKHVHIKSPHLLKIRVIIRFDSATTRPYNRWPTSEVDSVPRSPCRSAVQSAQAASEAGAKSEIPKSQIGNLLVHARALSERREDGKMGRRADKNKGRERKRRRRVRRGREKAKGGERREEGRKRERRGGEEGRDEAEGKGKSKEWVGEERGGDRGGRKGKAGREEGKVKAGRPRD
jgi:hypothetical protein